MTLVWQKMNLPSGSVQFCYIKNSRVTQTKVQGRKIVSEKGFRGLGEINKLFAFMLKVLTFPLFENFALSKRFFPGGLHE